MFLRKQEALKLQFSHTQESGTNIKFVKLGIKILGIIFAIVVQVLYYAIVGIIVIVYVKTEINPENTTCEMASIAGMSLFVPIIAVMCLISFVLMMFDLFSYGKMDLYAGNWRRLFCDTDPHLFRLEFVIVSAFTVFCLVPIAAAALVMYFMYLEDIALYVLPIIVFIGAMLTLVTFPGLLLVYTMCKLKRVSTDKAKQQLVIDLSQQDAANTDNFMNLVLEHDELCALFQEYAASEFSSENVLFWKQMKAIKIYDQKSMQQLWQQFIMANAPLELNLSGKTRNSFKQKLDAQAYDSQSLSNVRAAVETNLMDTFLRFQTSPAYQQFAKKNKTIVVKKVKSNL